MRRVGQDWPALWFAHDTAARLIVGRDLALFAANRNAVALLEANTVLGLRDGAITARCQPVGVPNHAPIPLLALWLKSPPGEIRSAQVQPRHRAPGTLGHALSHPGDAGKDADQTRKLHESVECFGVIFGKPSH